LKSKLLIIAICFCISLQAQEKKREYEERINESQMPKEALSILKKIPVAKKRLKHYLENDGSKTSFESKFKFGKNKYSVEFSEEGKLQDIEVEIRKIKSKEVMTVIENHLTANYEHFKIEKIQAQYQKLNSLETKPYQNPDAWELIVTTKNKTNKLERFEMTFDTKGEFLNLRIAVRQSYDFLLF